MKTFNFNCLIRVITLIFIIAATLALIISGRITLYLHPKMLIFLYIAIAFLSLMLISQLPLLFKEGKSGLNPVYLAFIIPILLGVGSGAGSMEKNVSEKKGVVVSKDTTVYSNGGSKEGPGEERSNPPLPREADAGGKAIVLNADNFLPVLNQLFNEPERFKGNRLVISGFAYNPKGFSDGQFAIARLTISCCAADAGVVGMICQAEEGQSYEPEQWYEVEGVMSSLTIEERTIPLLMIERSKAIEKPENIYVYQKPQ